MIERNEYRHQKAFSALQTVRHITMGLLFIAMGIMMFFADRFKIDALLSFDKLFRYFFGGICCLYGAFRFFRAFKKDS